MPNQERIEYLFQRYLDRIETPNELEELLDLIKTDEHKEAINQLFDSARQHSIKPVRLNDEQTTRIFDAIRLKTETGKVRSMKWRISFAAAVLVALCVGGYFFLVDRTIKGVPSTAAVQPAEQDVEAPKTARATITLADGRTIALDSLTAIAQNNVQLVKTANGEIVYSGAATEITYNTLTNPRGSRVIDIKLSDGSRVWLNAGSSITYPVAFVGNERKVNINGEAYFEVSHDKTKPFYVSKGAMQVQVLGTQFNVNAYDDEPAIEVTLLQGAVRVNDAILKPGQQASIANGSTRVFDNVSIEQAMAWKNGLFEFNETDIQTIMRQIEKWYDVQVVFESNITQHFNGTIQRQVNVSKVLGMLEKAGGIQFSIEGNKVLVKK